MQMMHNPHIRPGLGGGGGISIDQCIKVTVTQWHNGQNDVIKCGKDRSDGEEVIYST